MLTMRGVAPKKAPPTDTDFLTTRLWDRFLPKWRKNLERPALTPEQHDKLLAHLKELERAHRLTGKAARHVDTETAGFMVTETRVPAQRGKWRLLPPEACK